MMARSSKATRDNFRVVVEPRSTGDFGYVFMSAAPETEQQLEARCEAIAADIRRHVDDLPTRGRRGVTVEWDTHYSCEHCGRAWTEDSTLYNGGCCDGDEDAQVARETAAQELQGVSP